MRGKNFILKELQSKFHIINFSENIYIIKNSKSLKNPKFQISNPNAPHNALAGS